MLAFLRPLLQQVPGHNVDKDGQKGKRHFHPQLQAALLPLLVFPTAELHD